MRICHIIGDSAFGGGSRIVLALARDALRRGHEVHAVATAPLFCDHLRRLGVQVHEVDCIWRPVRPARDLAGLLRLRSFLVEQGFDLVHTHTSKAGFVGRLAAKTAGVPCVVHTVHGFAFHEATPAPVRTFHLILERTAAAFSDRVVTVSRFHRAWARGLGMASDDVLLAIPNGIPDPERPDPAAVAAFRAECGVASDGTLILSLGRLAPGKGLEHLVEAAALLAAQGRRGVRVVLAGNGEMEPELRRRIAAAGLEGNVILTGFRDDVGVCLGAADIVALPSEREGLSIALLEAMAAERAVVASRIGSNVEVAAGLADFVDYGDAPGLAAALAALIDEPERRAAMAARARARFVSDYREERMLDAYAQLYARLLSRTGR